MSPPNYPVKRIGARAPRAGRSPGVRRPKRQITTEANNALAFYQARGWRHVAIHRGAVAEARRLKPEIPKVGTSGLPKDDEIEFEITCGDSPPNDDTQPTTFDRG